MKSKKKKKITYAEETHYVDVETGESKTVRSYKSMAIDKEPPYVKIYLDDIASVNGLPPTASKVLNLLMTSMGYNNMIPLLKPFKQMICNNLDIKMNTLDKITGQLREKGIIHKFARGLYIMDPHLFAKGRWEDIQNLRLVIEYDDNGNRKLSSNAPEQLKQLSLKFD